MSKSLFDNPEFDPGRFARELRTPEPAVSYVLYFTPRSGSTWLADVVDSTGELGNPREWLNPNSISDNARHLNAKNSRTYFEMLRRKQARGGIFGLEVTYFQLNRVLIDNCRFFDLVSPSAPSFYLIREDIVAQAVSLSKAFSTGIFHAANMQEAALRDSDGSYVYDVSNITAWLHHLRSMEIRTEAFFHAFGVVPWRLTYERVTQQGGAFMADFFGRSLGLKERPVPRAESPYKKIGTQKNEDFANRFRGDQSVLVNEVEAGRREWVERTRLEQDNLFA